MPAPFQGLHAVRRSLLAGLLRPHRWRTSLVVVGLLFLIVSTILGFTMHLRRYLSAAALSALPVLSLSTGSEDADPFKIYNISAGSLTASFIPYGARLTHLLVPDRDGVLQDVAIGYDDPHDYLRDTLTDHTYFGTVVGRYANRIKNGTFTIDGKKYEVPKNEHDGINTLHGGFVGYDQRNWTVLSHSDNSITFSLLDPGWEDFPGTVLTQLTFTVDTDVTPLNPKGNPQLTAKLVSQALTEKTPIMLSNHIYWNLNAFREPDVRNDILHLPRAHRYVKTDGILIPTGEIGHVAHTKRRTLDFTRPKPIGRDIKYAVDLCGTGCTGYDNCFINDEPKKPGATVPILHLYSPATGITLDVASNQPALQIFTCDNYDGHIPVKPSQKKRNEDAGFGGVDGINQYACVVIETQGWIDGINHPEWRQKQIFGPQDEPTVNLAVFQFGTKKHK